MKTFTIFRKNLLEMWHEPQITLLELLVPLACLIIFWASYNGPLLVTHPVLISGDIQAAQPVIQVLQNVAYPNGAPMFSLRTETSAAAAEKSIRTHTANVQVTVKQEPGGLLSANVHGDATYMPFITGSTLIESILTPFLDARQGLAPRVEWVLNPIYPNEMKIGFDTLAPGMLVFMIMLLGPQAAIYLGREVRWGTLRRLRLTPLRPIELLAGITLGQTLLGLVITFIFLIVMRLLGIYNQGNWLLILLVVTPLAASAIGMGLLTACFTKNDFDAYNVASVFVMPQVLLSGAFYPMPPMTLFNLWGHSMGLFELIPASHTVIILRQVFLGGAGLEEIGFRLACSLVLSLLYFALGAVVFGKLKLGKTI